jgi:hypothetical protein
MKTHFLFPKRRNRMNIQRLFNREIPTYYKVSTENGLTLYLTIDEIASQLKYIKYKPYIQKDCVVGFPEQAFPISGIYKNDFDAWLSENKDFQGIYIGEKIQMTSFPNEHYEYQKISYIKSLHVNCNLKSSAPNTVEEFKNFFLAILILTKKYNIHSKLSNDVNLNSMMCEEKSVGNSDLLKVNSNIKYSSDSITYNKDIQTKLNAVIFEYDTNINSKLEYIISEYKHLNANVTIRMSTI